MENNIQNNQDNKLSYYNLDIEPGNEVQNEHEPGNNIEFKEYIDLETGNLDKSFYTRFSLSTDSEAITYSNLLHKIIGKNYVELYNFIDYTNSYFCGIITDNMIEKCFYDFYNKIFYYYENKRFIECDKFKIIIILEQTITKILLDYKNIIIIMN